jgi:hypothetical protein
MKPSALADGHPGLTLPSREQISPMRSPRWSYSLTAFCGHSDVGCGLQCFGLLFGQGGKFVC